MLNPYVVGEVPGDNKTLGLPTETAPPVGRSPNAMDESAKGYVLIALDELRGRIGRRRLRSFLLQVVSAL